MNFSPFGNPFQTSLPSMHQFATKFADPVIVNTTGVLSGQNTVMVTTLAGDASSGIQYLPVSTSNSSVVHSSQIQGTARIAAIPSNIQVMNSPPTGAKYSPGTLIGWENVPMHHFAAVDPKVVSVPYSQQNPLQSSSPPNVWPVRLLHNSTSNTDGMNIEYHEGEPQDLCKSLKDDKEMIKHEEKVEVIQIPIQAAAWQDATGTTVADYLSRLPHTSLPMSLHHFLKYSSEAVKKENMQELTLISEHQLNQHVLELEHQQHQQQLHNHHHHHHQQTQQEEIHQEPPQENHDVEQQHPEKGKRKKKKQKIKVKKPKYRPGEIRLSTALDGSTLFCCPECHVAYPERYSLEQHLAGHKLERKFVCDVCGAGLKRKEHLDQHKRGHSQERPFVCSICLKGFKRNEHLTRHYVIHSGDKTHICGECGKAFSRKDHLHKHAQTHIAKKVKAELSQMSMPSTPSMPVPAPIMS